jgi:hypothetical protein
MVAEMSSGWEIGISTDARSLVLRKRSSGWAAQSRLLRQMGSMVSLIRSRAFTRVEGSPNSVFVQVYDGEVFFAEPGSAARTGETLQGLGEDAWTKEGDVNFLQNNWTVSVTRITGQVSDADLLEMAELISSRLP